MEMLIYPIKKINKDCYQKADAMIKILLVEDHNIVRNGIKVLLEKDKDMLIVGEAVNGNAVLKAVEDGTEIDIILTDINMPELDGISMIKHLRAINSTIRVIVLSMHDNEKYLAAAFAEGTDGYLLKSVGAQELVFAIKHVHSGGKYLCAELGLKLLESFNQQSKHEQQSDIDFSLREIEVLNLIAEGLTNVEIADKLFVSKRTVEGHRQSLLEKTNSKNTAMLIRFAVLQGMVS
jgi:DNA-binding NarL/FixJ family response regulator